MQDWMLSFGLWGLAILYLLEGIGLPLPPELGFVWAGGLVHGGERPFWLMLGLIWLFTVMGNLMAYGIAYLGGRPALTRLAGWFGVDENRFVRAEEWMQRNGLKVLFFTRWINWGFGQSLWMAGLARLSPARFVPFLLVLNVVWAIVWLKLGKLLARWLDALGFFEEVAILAGVLLVVGFGFWWRRHKAKKITQS